MKKYSIIHIHTDIKFIHNINRFEGDEFENTLVIFRSKSHYKGIYKDSVKYYDYSRKDFLRIITLCGTADVVVLYDLNFPKAYIANRLAKSVIVVWRFFGNELYERIPEYIYSERTFKILKQAEKQNFYSRKKVQIKQYLAAIKYRAIRANELNNAFKRIDFFLGISKSEYEFLKTIWKNLPPFLQLNMTSYLEINTIKRVKTNLIILGNNRSPANNHLDIIDGLKESKNNSNYEFLLMFNYGSISTYSETVRKEACELKEIKVIDEFLPIEKFKELYTAADAFVMNGHRQMAMGNILEALQQNIKIYLNEKNLIFSWLKEEGFVLFTIENFFSDLENDNIALSRVEAIINQEQLVKLTTKHDKQAFQKTLLGILGDGRKPKSP